ncbi:MAG: tripartite tricarboxylate transporter substrate binding protein [Rhodoplanes sp.]|uniref:Bug family tripartite tricarboxylate transporter substrate binding protein n=1 Tax=Rhodoplanes sp. TaxID=1968906 RepID=UPI0017A887F2|nr:tripartite tricarboxylate transporter substrate binding protein [Rhodoplanes sp.]NVO16918.1 tripartite tricarboxylate transporter substrate binding protein [Rhodoplanes sp.]
MITKGLLVAALTAGALIGTSQAQDFPRTTIQLVNPYAAGGSADLLARTIAAAMADVLGKEVIVVNKPGAGTTIGASFVAHAEPDGHTLYLSTATAHAIMPLLSKVTYDGIADFAPVAMVANVPNVLVVRASLPIRSVPELVAYTKAHPDTLNFGSVGIGSQPHLAAELFKQMTGATMVHVPYTGVAPATTDLVSGQMDLGFLNAPPLLQHIESGALRALAVTTLKRADQLPNVPTLDELGLKGFDIGTWYGISAPAKTPRAVLDKLGATLATVMSMPAVRQKIVSQGSEVFYLDAKDFAAYLKLDADRMARLIATAQIKAR